VKIAQIAPLMESVPPRLYGGTERIVYYLTEELVRQGHDVTLFATADSVTSAELVPCARSGLRLDPNVRDVVPHYMVMLDKVRQRAGEFDILHFHIDHFHFPLFHHMARRTVTTLHGRQDSPDLPPFFNAFRDMPLVAISNDQRKPIPEGNFVATVHHGIPADLYSAVFKPRGEYIAFLGRMSRDKGPDRAIRLARILKVPLKMAAKVDKADRDYFEQEIMPLLRDPNIEFVGEVNDWEKQDFLGNARALLFPIVWPEPFGIAMIEAMACATPILAFRCGAVTEVVDDGITGRIVESEEQALLSLEDIFTLDRHKIRLQFEERFTSARMTADYLSVYQALIRDEWAKSSGEALSRESAV
jgi:glycosyltransferase involved in cell wall biosynthesis